MREESKGYPTRKEHSGRHGERPSRKAAGRLAIRRLLAGLILSVLGWTTGCDRRADSRAPSPGAVSDRSGLEAQLRETRDRQLREREELTAILREKERVQQELEEEFRKQMALKDQRIADLESRLKATQRQLRDGAPVQPGPRVSTARLEPEDAPAVPLPEEPAPDFPVRVFGVKGQTIITGTQVTYRLVASDETFRDEFGNVKNVIRSEPHPIYEYAYQVTFSIENLSGADQDISARAGAATRDLVLPAGATLTNLALTAARGSGLRVLAGSRARTIPVTYPEAVR